MYLNPIAEREVIWYRKNGKYPERIVTNNQNKLYVIGDWSWNRLYPNKFEEAEKQMKLFSDVYEGL